MVIHKRTKLTPLQPEALYNDRYAHRMRICDLMRKYQVSAPTVYKIINRGKQNDFTVHKSTNHRFRCLKYGIKRLAKIEHDIEERLKKQVPTGRDTTRITPVRWSILIVSVCHCSRDS